MRERSYGWLVFAVFVLQACSATIDVDKAKLKGSPIGCLKGSTPLVCPCPDGTMSVQVCNDLGRYDPCQCDAFSSAGTGG